MRKLIRNQIEKPYRGQNLIVSVSGGVDSMVALDFLRQYNNVEALHINHGTGTFANMSQALVTKYCNDLGIQCRVHSFDGVQPKSDKERVWRDYRYSVYAQYTDKTIVQAHTLNDQVEQYLMSFIKGSTRYIGVRNNNLYRPFLDIPKDMLYEYAAKYDVPYIEDPTNFEFNGMYDNQRAFVRNVLLPNALIVNPGLFKTVRKFIKSNEFKKDDV